MATLTLAGITRSGSFHLTMPSKSVPGLTHDCFVNAKGTRCSCDCAACAFHPWADEAGRLTVSVADVRAGRVPRCCLHLKRSARLAPLLVAGYVGTGGRA